MVGTVKFEGAYQKLVENLPELAVLVEPLLIVRRVIRKQLGVLHRRLLAIVREDDVCRRLMTIPGVGPLVARPSGSGVACRRWRRCVELLGVIRVYCSARLLFGSTPHATAYC